MEQRTVRVSNGWALTRLLSSVVLLAAPVLGATETFTATAHSRRPLLEVVEKVEAEYLWRINYEDPPFENVNELEDLTSTVYKASHPNPSDVFLIPRAKPFTFSWEDSGVSTDLRTTVERLVSQHHGSGNPGRFQTLYQGNVCHIFPLSLLKKDGTMVSARSVLDARISFPVQQRTLFDVLQLIFQLVGAQTKSHIVVGMVNPNAAFHKISTGADNITARDALMIVFNAYDAGNIGRGGLPERFTWRLLYQAGDNTYFFNLHRPFDQRPLASPRFLSPR